MMEFVLILAYTLLFVFIIWKWKWFHDNRVNRYVFILLFIIKIGAGIFAGELFKQRYYGGDSFAFFDNSQVITKSFYINKTDFINIMVGLGNDRYFINQYGEMLNWNNTDVVYNDSRTIIRLNALIGLISMGYYNVHVVFFAFLSMLGLMAIYKVTRLLTDQNPYLLMGAVFLVPGVMFWCSMAAKESLLMLAMGMFLYHCVRLLTVSKSLGNVIGMCLAGFLFIHIKAYFLLLITPCLLAFTWVHVTNQKFSLLKYGIIYLVGMVVIFNIKYLVHGFDPVDVLVMKRLNFEAYASAAPEDFGSYIQLPEFSSAWGDIITATPIAVFSVLAQPYLWESSNILMILAAIENVCIFLVILAGMRYVRWDRMARNKNLLLFCVFFVFSAFALIGLTSPVLGAIVRYKSPVLPFLLMIPLLISGVYQPRKL